MVLLRAISTIGGFTMISRVFGFLRDILIASFLGAGTVADAFFAAFRFPNLFRRIFAEGAFAAAFVPIFSERLEQDGRRAARVFAEEAFSVLSVFLLVFVLLFEISMPWAIYLIAHGFESVPGKMELAVELTRIAFPYLLFVSLVSLQSGVLNSLGFFAAAAFAPVLLNLTLIAALLGFSDSLQTPGHALAWGVFAAGVVQFVWLVIACRRAGMGISLRLPRLSPDVRRLGRRILPVIFGSSLYQINLLISTNLASRVSDGAISYLYYGDRVVQLPVGVIGVAVGTALLPFLSRQIAAGDLAAAGDSQNRALEFSLLLTLPATIALLIIAEPVTAVLFERNQFTALDTAATTPTLAAFAAGLPAYVLIKVLAPGFFARGDTRTPVKIAALCMAVNIALNLILMQFLAHIGIALGLALSSWLNALLLGWVLNRRGLLTFDDRLRSRAPRILLASLVMGAVLWGGLLLLNDPLAGGELVRALALAGLILMGVGAFGAAAPLTGAASLADLRRLMRKRTA